jgi:hypothetical protein
MSFRFFLIISCALAMQFSVFANEAEKSALGEFQSNTVEPKKDELIKKSLELVTKRVAELEKRFEDLHKNGNKTRFKSVQANKKKVVILNDDIGEEKEGRFTVNHLKFVEYQFEGNKVKQIVLVYEKKNFFEDFNDFTKTLTIDPSNIENSNIQEKRKTGVEKVEYKDFSPETKYRTMKALERQLLTAIFRVEILMRHKNLKDDYEANQMMQGI